MTLRTLNVRLAALVKRRPVAMSIASAVVALSVAAVANDYLAKKAERDNPPTGRFIEVDGVKLHYVDRGSGDTVVLLHGNGSMIEDFESSGLIEMASRKYRVIAFDRPGFGHSTRPRGTLWTPEKQADLIHRALTRIGVARATVLGHSWGASVAVALALKHPGSVAGLVLASGYYYPTVRADVVLLSWPAIPVVGDILGHTVAPLLSRLFWPILTGTIFAPAPVPNKFGKFPKEMAVRPSQIRASAVETALLIPTAFVLQDQYASLRMPVVIIAGEQDRLIDIEEQSARLHQDVRQSTFRPVTNTGHMVHQTATARVMAAIDEAVELAPVASQTEGCPAA